MKLAHWAGLSYLEGYWRNGSGDADPWKRRLKSRRLFEVLCVLHSASGHALLDVSLAAIFFFFSQDYTILAPVKALGFVNI